VGVLPVCAAKGPLHPIGVSVVFPWGARILLAAGMVQVSSGPFGTPRYGGTPAGSGTPAMPGEWGGSFSDVTTPLPLSALGSWRGGGATLVACKVSCADWVYVPWVSTKTLRQAARGSEAGHSKGLGRPRWVVGGPLLSPICPGVKARGGWRRGGETSSPIPWAFKQSHTIGTAGVVHISLRGVKSYDQGKMN